MNPFCRPVLRVAVGLLGLCGTASAGEAPKSLAQPAAGLLVHAYSGFEQNTEPVKDPSIIRPTAHEAASLIGEEWEHLPDGSLGQVREFHGVDGVAIAAYIRKPAGDGPFPAIVWMHGGRDSKQATIGMGRSQKTPVEELVQAGWAIYAADYRHGEKIGIYPIEFDDTVKAVEAARALPFVDPKRVGYMGHSHGAQVGTLVVSRVDLSGAVLCAPASMDFIEIKKAIQAGGKPVPILSKMLADLEQQYGAAMEEIAKDPAKYGYSSAVTEAAHVRCPLDHEWTRRRQFAALGDRGVCQSVARGRQASRDLWFIWLKDTQTCWLKDTQT